MAIFLYLIAAYFIGNFITGYFVIKLLGKKDIRAEGSGNPGARNAGRIHGKMAFVLTFLGDALKAALAVLAGRYLEFSASILLLGLAAVLIGHIKPVLFKFRGGMGISAFIGGMLAFQPVTALVLIGGFGLFYPFTKSFTMAGLGAFIMIPVVFYFLGHPAATILLTIMLIMVILVVHTEDIKERLYKKGK